MKGGMKNLVKYNDVTVITSIAFEKRRDVHLSFLAGEGATTSHTESILFNFTRYSHSPQLFLKSEQRKLAQIVLFLCVFVYDYGKSHIFIFMSMVFACIYISRLIFMRKIYIFAYTKRELLLYLHKML